MGIKKAEPGDKVIRNEPRKSKPLQRIKESVNKLKGNK